MSIKLGGPEKAYDADITIAAHAVYVRTTMLSLASNLKGSQVFKLQDEHNASYFQNVVDRITPTRPQSYEIIMRFITMRLNMNLHSGSFFTFQPAFAADPL